MSTKSPWEVPSGSMIPSVTATTAPANIWPSPPMFQSRAVNGMAAARPVRIRMAAVMIVWPRKISSASELLMMVLATVQGLPPKATTMTAMTAIVSRIEPRMSPWRMAASTFRRAKPPAGSPPVLRSLHSASYRPRSRRRSPRSPALLSLGAGADAAPRRAGASDVTILVFREAVFNRVRPCFSNIETAARFSESGRAACGGGVPSGASAVAMYHRDGEHAAG